VFTIAVHAEMIAPKHLNLRGYQRVQQLRVVYLNANITHILKEIEKLNNKQKIKKEKKSPTPTHPYTHTHIHK